MPLAAGEVAEICRRSARILCHDNRFPSGSKERNLRLSLWHRVSPYTELNRPPALQVVTENEFHAQRITEFSRDPKIAFKGVRRSPVCIVRALSPSHTEADDVVCPPLCPWAWGAGVCSGAISRGVAV